MIDFLVNLALFIYQQIVNQDLLYFGKFLIKKKSTQSLLLIALAYNIY